MDLKRIVFLSLALINFCAHSMSKLTVKDLGAYAAIGITTAGPVIYSLYQNRNEIPYKAATTGLILGAGLTALATKFYDEKIKFPKLSRETSIYTCLTVSCVGSLALLGYGLKEASWKIDTKKSEVYLPLTGILASLVLMLYSKFKK